MVAKSAFVLLWPFLFELSNQRSIVDPGFINPSDDLRGAPSKSGLTPDQNQPGACVWGCLCLERWWLGWGHYEASLWNQQV